MVTTLNSLTTGNLNTVIGYNAGGNVTGENICIGGQSGANITTVSSNITIGLYVGGYQNSHTGQRNISIGYQLI